MSISWEGVGGSSARREHQLGRVWRHFGEEASIMSISWEGFGSILARRPAS